jgi:uncharacterized protein (TIGR03435 family)
MNRRITIPAVLACLGVALIGTVALMGQDGTWTFEVASLRPSGSNSGDDVRVGGGAVGAPVGQMGGPGTSNPARIFYSRASLQRLLMNAYQVQADQLSGPDWLGAEKFDITANIRKGTTQEQVNVMLQNLLIERFKLALHHTTKEGPVYELTVAKGGPKLKESSNSVARGGHTRMETAHVNGLQRKTCRGCTMAELIEGVQGFDEKRMAPDRIVDKTGLSGKYDFTLEYVSSTAPGMPLKLSALQSQSNAGQDVFAALEKQLGLRLDKGRAAVDMVIVDHIEKTPAEN